MSDMLRHDPINVAERLRWARAHWREDNSQPRDLDGLLERAAETLDKTVPSFWRIIAAIEAVALIITAIVLQHYDW